MAGINEGYVLRGLLKLRRSPIIMAKKRILLLFFEEKKKEKSFWLFVLSLCLNEYIYKFLYQEVSFVISLLFHLFSSLLFSASAVNILLLMYITYCLHKIDNYTIFS